MKEVDLMNEDGLEKNFSESKLQLDNDYSNSNGNVSNFDTKKGQLTQVPWPGDKAEDFFASRCELLFKAIDDAKKEILDDEDGDFVGFWLLTEVSSWDNEMERIVMLTSRSLITIKYDFIASKALKHRKVPLDIVDTLVVGDLQYPPVSLIPHIDGIATGVTNLMKGCLVKVLEKKWPEQTLANETGFSPRTRNIAGVRTMWNGGRPLPFIKRWNPFEKDIPFNTFTSHPLLWHTDSTEESSRELYDVEHFTSQLKNALDQKIKNSLCFVENNPIVLENYIGLPALIHNKNSLGFFKLRGKISF